MVQKWKQLSKHEKTEAFALSLMAILFFIVVGHYRDKPELQLYDGLYFLVYLSGALAINYFFLPRFFYKKKYSLFFMGVLAVVVFIMAMEVLVLQEIFCPNKFDKQFLDIIYFAFAEVLPVLMVFVGLKLALDALRKEANLEKLKQTAAESELQFLKSQINPHFLFNNLNNLYAYSLEQSPKTPKIILGLSSLLRYMLYDCREKMVTLEKEVKYLQDFVRLQELQIEHRGKIDWRVTGDIGGKWIAPLILMVFVENCFKHSLSSQTKGIEINIYLNVENENLTLFCTNTFSANKNTYQLSSGIGLENVQTRLELLYPKAYTLQTSTQNNVFSIQLELQLNQIL